MTISPAAGGIPAAWYPDPSAPGTERWWDGTAWTAHTRMPPPAGPAYAAPTPAQPSVAQPAFAQTAFAQPALAQPSFADYVPASPAYDSGPYVPFASGPGATSFRDATPNARRLVAPPPALPVWTGPIVVFALIPLLVNVAFAILIVYALEFAVLVLGPVNLAVWLLGLIVAATDRRALQFAGHPSQAHPAWALLAPLAYVISRNVHVSRTATGSWQPTLLWIGCSIGGNLALVSTLLPALSTITAQLLVP